VVRTFRPRHHFAKLFAQKLTRAGTPAIALCKHGRRHSLVFAQSPAAPPIWSVAQASVSSVGGRGGVPRFAQGGVPAAHLSTSSSFCATQQLQSEPELIRWRSPALHEQFFQCWNHASFSSISSSSSRAAACRARSSAPRSSRGSSFANIATPGTRSICAVDGGPIAIGVWIPSTPEVFSPRSVA